MLLLTVGTDLLYGNADWEIPLLKKKRIFICVKANKTLHEPRSITTTPNYQVYNDKAAK